MKYVIIILGILLLALLLCLFVTYICFRRCFYNGKKREEGFKLPDGEIYAPYKDIMKEWYDKVTDLPYTTLSVTSFDGLKLFGNYYECNKGGVIEIMFHGYRGDARRDLSGGVERCFRLNRNVLLVDMRAAGKSEGNVISFGVNESRDAALWVDEVIRVFGPDVKIILTGISMGASTVLMAAGRKLPQNVVGVLADCGYSTQEEIIKKTIREMHLPQNIMYPFVTLGAKIFGRFNLNEYTPLQAVKSATVPIIFFHGTNDDFVPADMGKQMAKVCAAPHKLVLVEGAGHGLSFPAAMEEYLKEVSEFFTQNGVKTEVIKKI